MIAERSAMICPVSMLTMRPLTSWVREPGSGTYWYWGWPHTGSRTMGIRLPPGTLMTPPMLSGLPPIGDSFGHAMLGILGLQCSPHGTFHKPPLHDRGRPDIFKLLQFFWTHL